MTPTPILVPVATLMFFIAAAGDGDATRSAGTAAPVSAQSKVVVERAESAAPPDEKVRSVDPDQAAAAAREVLQGPQFWWKHRSDVDDPTRRLGFLSRLSHVIETVWDWLVAGLKRLVEFILYLFNFAPPGLKSSTAAARIIVCVLAVAAIAFLGWKGYGLLRRRKRPPAVELPDDTSRLEQLPDALVLLARAQAALQAGDNVQALRFAFLALLALLQDRGILRYSRGRTNSEYSRDLRGQPSLATDFRGVALPFERAQYGKIEPSRIEARQAIAVCRSLLPEKAQAS
jgi:hypothetical protein